MRTKENHKLCQQYNDKAGAWGPPNLLSRSSPHQLPSGAPRIPHPTEEQYQQMRTKENDKLCQQYNDKTGAWGPPNLLSRSSPTSSKAERRGPHTQQSCDAAGQVRALRVHLLHTLPTTQVGVLHHMLLALWGIWRLPVSCSRTRMHGSATIVARHPSRVPATCATGPCATLAA